ncbi:LANO_0C04610g1_1 [Lachancea nothofagi CBS 11611]|uniref:LANO_0C04610g1_1 n=1 Tax=Lachancea nothofagi CBS 11611 TaxID=1266666 RepID=A0A1G4J6P5_9SACH|nr:LANO_0C04610g1_1 [Lachancea nothofagi CBS 11611]
MANPIESKILELADKTGLDEVTLKLAICLFSSFPFNALLKRLPDGRITLKCWYIVGISAFYLFGVLNIFTGFRTLFISSMFTYVISRFYRSKFMPYLNFVVVMGHLAISHLGAQFFTTRDASKLDITGAQMVLVMKLTSFAWSYHDGTELDQSKLSEYQKTRAIKKHPSLLSFLAYTFFYPSLFTGPSFDFADFESWLNCEVFRDLPDAQKPRRRWTTTDRNLRRQIPKCGWLVSWRVVQGVFWITLSSILPNYISKEFMFTADYGQKSFLYKIHYLFILSFTFRLKYYAAWTMSEASCILCGLGYNGYDTKTKKIRWDRVRNIDIWKFETASNTHEGLEAWNMNTNKWLKHYVYLRVVAPGSRPGFRSTLFTFLTSAFWHGTRPGYYLSFATGALYQTCGKLFRRNLRPIFLSADGKALPSKIFYDVICFYVMKLAFGYLVQPFVILDLPDSLACWRSVYFYIHLGIIATFFTFKGPFAKPVIKYLKSYQAAAIVQKKQKDELEEAGPLGDIARAKRLFEQGELPSDMHLGIPEANFDKLNFEEAKREFSEFFESYDKWRAEKGLEIEEHNLQRAFENFKRELSSGQRRTSFSFYSPKPFKKED